MRIRSIKPEFWRSEDINQLTLEDRLLFIGLWSYVDDNGVGKDQESAIVADLFAHDLSVSPHDTLMRVQGGLKRLHAAQMIRRYTVQNRGFLEIVNWSKHQKVNRPSPPRYPTSEDNHAVLTESSLSPQNSDGAGTGEQGNRGTGEQTLSRTGSAGTHDEELALIPTEETGPTLNDRFQEFWDAYPRRADKQKAIKAFEKAVRRANPDTIIRAAADYRDDPNREDQYTKYPATWLNADAWENGPLPARATNNNQDRRAEQIVDLVARNMPNPNQQRGALEA